MFTCEDLMAEIRDDDEMIDAYTPHWVFIKTRYESRHSKKTQDKKLYVIRASTPSIKYLAAILQLIHQEQRVAYKYNLQFSYILRNIETDELRLYYHGNNSRFHETPPLVEKDPDLDKEIEKYEAADIFESTIVQRPNTKWQLERIVGFAVTSTQFVVVCLVQKVFSCPNSCATSSQLSVWSTTLELVSHTTTICAFFVQLFLQNLLKRILRCPLKC